jgi:hypothetical protein
VFQGIPHRCRYLLRLVFLRSGEHHHEKGEQQRNEIGVGNQPPFVVFMRAMYVAPQAGSPVPFTATGQESARLDGLVFIC